MTKSIPLWMALSLGLVVPSVVGPACNVGLDFSVPDAGARPDGDEKAPTAPAGVAADGAAPNASLDASTATDGAPPDPADFAARCAASGVLRCIGFDAESDLAGGIGNATGILPGSTGKPVLDRSVRASGAASLLFVIPENAGSDPSGAYFANFSDDYSVQFGQNEEFFVQWRQRFSPEFLDTAFRQADGSVTAWKQTIIGVGDQPGCTPDAQLSLEGYPGVGRCAFSCTALEVVTNTSYSGNFPTMYNSCRGSASHGPYDGFYERFGAHDFKMQNAMPAPHCLYSQGETNPPTLFPPQGNCFPFVANEWMTFQVRVAAGALVGDEFKNSHVDLWVARQGQPSMKVLDWGPYHLTAGDPALKEKFGKVWLLPYMTGKSPSRPNPRAYTWYDELIVSRQLIADPK